VWGGAQPSVDGRGAQPFVDGGEEGGTTLVVAWASVEPQCALVLFRVPELGT